MRSEREYRAIEALIVAAMRGITPEQIEEAMAKRTNACKWHVGEESIDEEDLPSCPNCQRVLQTKTCKECGQEFLDWGSEGYDDVMAAPRASSSGDMCCSGCIAQVERETLEAIEDGDYEEKTE